MLKKEEYLKTVRRPYPVLFTSLVLMGYCDQKNFKGLLKKPFSLQEMAHVDQIWYYSKSETEEGGKLTLDSWKDPALFKHVQKEFKQKGDKLISSAKKDFGSYCKAYQQYMPALALVFLAEKPTETALRNALSQKLSLDEAEHLLSELNVPLQNNFYRQEEYELVQTKNLSRHVRNYEWILARYGEDRKYTLKDAQKKLKEIDTKPFLKRWKEDKAHLRKTIARAKKLLGKQGYLVDIFQYIIYYRTQRTDIMNKSSYLAIPMLKKTAQSLGLSYQQLLFCCADEVLDSSIPSKEKLNKRIKDASTLLEGGRLRCITGKENDKVKSLFSESIGTEEEIKGTIACKGYAEGMVKKIVFKEDFAKINTGDILITSMTTPEMVPIMKKAAAFITDEGGVTCHAAIISREMKKPCIIGTKIATQALKDGDLVEVDAEKGVVKILNRRKS